jgi:hypothetical protein
MATFRDKGSVWLGDALIERQDSLNLGHIDFKQSISGNNGLWV